MFSLHNKLICTLCISVKDYSSKKTLDCFFNGLTKNQILFFNCYFYRWIYLNDQNLCIPTSSSFVYGAVPIGASIYVIGDLDTGQNQDKKPLDAHLPPIFWILGTAETEHFKNKRDTVLSLWVRGIMLDIKKHTGWFWTSSVTSSVLWALGWCGWLVWRLQEVKTKSVLLLLSKCKKTY